MEITAKMMERIRDAIGCDNLTIEPTFTGIKMTAHWVHGNEEKVLSRYYSTNQCMFAIYPDIIFEEFIHAAQKITENINELGFHSCESEELGYIQTRRYPNNPRQHSGSEQV